MHLLSRTLIIWFQALHVDNNYIYTNGIKSIFTYTFHLSKLPMKIRLCLFLLKLYVELTSADGVVEREGEGEEEHGSEFDVHGAVGAESWHSTVLYNVPLQWSLWFFV